MKKQIVSVSVLALGLAAMASPALAQASEGQSGAETRVGGLEDIVVTARRVSENLQDVPVAVTAFSGDTLVKQNATLVADIARSTPSLVFREANSSPAASTITLRGQVQTDILATLDPSVGTYVDDYYWARAYGLNSNLLDIASVQVLKGPQGTLFGRNTTGGAILIQTADPSFDGASGMVSATYGRYNERTGTAVLNLPLIDDKVALRGAFVISKRDGYTRDTVSGRHYDNRDSWTGRLKLLIKPTDNLSFIFSAERFRTEVDAPSRRLLWIDPAAVGALQAGGGAVANAYIASIADHPNQVVNDYPPQAKIKTQTYIGTAELDTIFGAIKFVGGYRKISGAAAIDLDGSLFAILPNIGFQSLSQYSGELQITGKAFGDSLDFAAGALYFHEQGVDRTLSFSIPRFNPATLAFRGNIDNDSMGVYAQASWHLTDKLTFTGGGRYSVDDKGLALRNTTIVRATGLVICQIPGLASPGCLASRHDDFTGWSYTAGFDYKLSDDALVYIKTSKGFRSGGQNLRASGPYGFVPFEPEIAYSHEVGLKSEFFDRRLRFNAAAYYSRVNDLQRSTLQQVSPGVTATILGNAGKARIWGLELDATAELFEGFTVQATGTVTRPKYLEYADASGDRRQERFESVARNQFSVAATYEHQFDSVHLTLRGDYSWQGKAPLSAYNTPRDPNNAAIVANTTGDAAGVLSARAALGFADDQFEVSIFGRNLTDNRDVVSALYVPGLNFVSGQLREPRTFGVTGTFRLGQ